MATATGLTITNATCTATDIIVQGPSLVAGNKPAIQTFLNSYTYDSTFGKTVSTVITINASTALTWTNMPSALTGLTQTECKFPMQDAGHARLTARVLVAGSANAVLIAQFSLDGTNYTSGPQVAIATGGLKVSNLGVIPSQFRTDCFFRLAGQGGDGAADPQFGLITVQFG
jgi:hypothetical protein